ncbi:uncharacterized protein N7479_000515 [Penicillium vulpinum]|uniref:uncharacterized protein n=1 Tax=Penicillium vulpinum TaxID=29845 RepID=UPI002549BF40|nr:uncharacterized protein N7479_000515 [Penicillium vulpinum]KAJ5970597.1 hypothetical protein N7479_000515 [Penicillium vulpinum]
MSKSSASSGAGSVVRLDDLPSPLQQVGIFKTSFQNSQTNIVLIITHLGLQFFAERDTIENRIWQIGGELKAQRQKVYKEIQDLRREIDSLTRKANRFDTLVFQIRRKILTKWCGHPTNPIETRQQKQAVHGGNILADTNVILRMETEDYQRAVKWKGAFAAHYNIPWAEHLEEQLYRTTQLVRRCDLAANTKFLRRYSQLGDDEARTQILAPNGLQNEEG